MSGADPCTGSNRPGEPAPSDALGSIPIDPVSIAASSERMSPKRFSVSSTSKLAGALTSCIAALSTSRCSSCTPVNSRACTLMTTSRHRREVSSTFALSTLVTFAPDPADPARRPAASNATRAIRSTSTTE